MPAELACHAIIDRLGEISLLRGRLEGVKAEFDRAGHKDAIPVLQQSIEYFIRSY